MPQVRHADHVVFDDHDSGDNDIHYDNDPGDDLDGVIHNEHVHHEHRTVDAGYYDIHHVVGPGDIVKYDDTEYVLVRRDHLDNLHAVLDDHTSYDDCSCLYDAVVALLNPADADAEAARDEVT